MNIKKDLKTIIITGGTGVIGHEISQFLKKQNKYEIILFGKNELNDKSFLTTIVSKKIFCLIHLAGKDDYNSKSKNEISKVNDNLTFKISKFCQYNLVQNFIFASTNRVYEGVQKD